MTEQEATDRAQDARITANAEAIKQQTEYLKEIRNHFLPEAEASRMKRLAKQIVSPMLKGVAIIAFIGGMWDFFSWTYDRYEISSMASRYAEIAKDIYYSENNADVALEFISKAVELQDTNAEYRFLQSYIKGMAATRKLLNLDRPMTREELNEAHMAYAEARYLRNLEPDRAEPYILESQILAALKEPDRARKAIEKAIELDPKNDFAYVRLALLSIKEKPTDERSKDAIVAEVAEALDHAIELNPKSKWAWLYKGYLANNVCANPVEARECYNKSLEIDPKFDMAYHNRGWTWMIGKESTRDYVKAREDFMKALQYNPDYKEACYAMGMSYGYQDNYSVGKCWMDKAILLDDKYLTALKWQGVMNAEMDDNEAAVESYDKAILLDPMNHDLYVRRARVLVRLGRTNDAIRDLFFAADLDPSAKRCHFYLGDLYLKDGKIDLALKSYDRAIAIDAEYSDAHAGKAFALVKKNDSEGALAEIDRAIETVKSKPLRFWLKKAEILRQFGQEEEAKQAEEKARALLMSTKIN